MGRYGDVQVPGRIWRLVARAYDADAGMGGLGNLHSREEGQGRTGSAWGEEVLSSVDALVDARMGGDGWRIWPSILIAPVHFNTAI
jgi:hypothetical protein